MGFNFHRAAPPVRAFDLKDEHARSGSESMEFRREFASFTIPLPTYQTACNPAASATKQFRISGSPAVNIWNEHVKRNHLDYRDRASVKGYPSAASMPSIMIQTRTEFSSIGKNAEEQALAGYGTQTTITPLPPRASALQIH